MQSISIVGAGPCGCLLAIYLARRGYRIDVYEKRPDMRIQQNDRGRSINLAISARGLRALEKAGLKERILAQSVPIKGRKIHLRETGAQERLYIYGRNDTEVNYSISRKTLNLEILNAASQYPNVNFHFDHQILGIDLEKSILHAKNADNSQQIKVGRVISTDGAISAIRHSLIQNNMAQFTVTTLDHGYKEILLPKENSQTLDPNYLHIWPRKEFMLMGLANLDGSFTMTLFMPLTGTVGLENLKDHPTIYDFFNNYFPDFFALFPQAVESFAQNPISNLTTVQGGPWYLDDRLLLIGDAAHAIVPFFGQGVNCGFEDCRLFDEFLEHAPLDQGLFEKFYQARKTDTDAILSMAAQNYDEMKHHVGETDFTFVDHIEKELMRRFPDRYLSRYILVSYTHQPYDLVQKTGVEQKQLVNKIFTHFSATREINWEVVTPWVNDYLARIEALKSQKKAEHGI